MRADSPRGRPYARLRPTRACVPYIFWVRIFIIGNELHFLEILLNVQ